MKKTIQTVLLAAVIMLCAMIAVSAETTISVDSVTVKTNETVTVPVRVSGNTGILGATVKVTFDEALELTNIARGDALSGLTLTMPGSTDINPVVFVWDGMAVDTSNGEVASLTFRAPEAAGTYGITVSFEPDDVVDENLESINAKAVSGVVTVEEGNTQAEDPDPSNEKTELTVDSLSGEAGETVDVSVSLKNNRGICGATVSIAYDPALTLTDIRQGDALNLTMTKPGSLTVNPIVLVWDGMTADSSEGTIVVLTFTLPSQAGTYPVTLSFDDDAIVDGDLNPIEVEATSGAITVNSDEMISVTLSDDCSIRTTGDVGVRFSAFISADDKAKADEFGFLVARSVELGANTDTLCFPAGFVSLAGENETKVGTTASGVTFICGTSYDKETEINRFGDGDDGYAFNLVLIGFLNKSQYTEKLSVRPYVRLGGTYFYGNVQSQDAYTVAKTLDESGKTNDYVKSIIKACEGE